MKKYYNIIFFFTNAKAKPGESTSQTSGLPCFEAINTFTGDTIIQGTLLYDQIRDSVIKRLEFCFDLFWKYLKDFLEEEHGILVASPKATLRESFKQNIVDQKEFEILNNLVTDRNNTSHQYDTNIAQAIAQRAEQYLKSMRIVKSRIVKTGLPHFIENHS